MTSLYILGCAGLLVWFININFKVNLTLACAALFIMHKMTPTKVLLEALISVLGISCVGGKPWDMSIL